MLNAKMILTGSNVVQKCSQLEWMTEEDKTRWEAAKKI